MQEGEERLEFGHRRPGERYTPRPGAYAVILDAEGLVAVMQTPRGCWLPGGGSEGAETPEETLNREVREECGFGVHLVRRVGEADEYLHTAGHDVGIRKECVFFLAAVDSSYAGPKEADHTLLWLDPTEAQVRLVQSSQRWAVSRATDRIDTGVDSP